MKTYKEPAKEINIKEEVDVLVVGSGPAGIGAALAAARQGAKTMLIEQCGDVGGIATTGLMSHWVGNIKSNIYDEIIELSKEEGPWWDKTINQEKLKTVLLDLLSKAGVIVQLYTFASDVILEDNKIVGVITESKSGREAIMCKVAIDASGDGDVAARAGVPFVKGRETDNRMQPMTIMFKVAGVDIDRVTFVGSFESTYQVEKGDVQTLARQNIPFPAGHLLIYRTTMPDVVNCNMTNIIEVDGTKSEDLTKATIVCRSQMDSIVKFLREFIPGFENCYAISSASLIGVRETRHFEGEYCLNENDILASKVFEDWAVVGCQFNFDVHNMSGAGLDETGCQQHFPKIEGYTIPYRSLVPKKIDNLLLAGRNISGTHMAHSSYRAMPICMGMGQAAGTAAAICTKEGIVARDLQVEKLQTILTEQGINPYKK